MTVTQITELHRGRCTIRLSDDSLITLYKAELKELDIREGEELSQAAYERIMTEILPKRCRLRLLNLLQKRSYTEGELRGKLKTGGYPEAIAEDAIGYVRDMRLIDDLEYCKTYIAYGSSKKSLKRLCYDLRAKGVGDDIIRRAMSETGADGSLEDEEKLIRRLMDKRGFDPKTATYEEKGRMRAYLYGKGFDADKVSRLTT